MSNTFPYGTKPPEQGKITVIFDKLASDYSIVKQDTDICVTVSKNNESTDNKNQIGDIVRELTNKDYTFSISQDKNETNITITQKVIGEEDGKGILRQVKNVLVQNLPEDKYVVSTTDKTVNVQLHNDSLTDSIAGRLAEKGLSLKIDKGFEVPPKIIVEKPTMEY